MSTKIITASEARSLGLNKYFTGKHCKHGHISERYTKTGTCYDCCIAQSKNWSQNNKEKRLETSRAHHHKKRNNLVKEPQSIKDFFLKKQKSTKKSIEKKNELVKSGLSKPYIRDKLKDKQKDQNRRALLYKINSKLEISSIKELEKIQKGKCAICLLEIKKYHIDHIIPLSRGGTNERKNLQLLCKKCNLSKGAKNQVDFALTIGLLC